MSSVPLKESIHISLVGGCLHEENDDTAPFNSAERVSCAGTTKPRSHVHEKHCLLLEMQQRRTRPRIYLLGYDESRHGGMRMRWTLTFAIAATVLIGVLTAQEQTASSSTDKDAFIRTAQQNVFMTSTLLPDCYTYSILRGDPKAGPSVTLSKLASGCKVPWHTHSANAQVLFVGGSFELQMKGQEAQILHAGAYAYVPAHHEHQETCVEACMYYVIREGAADVHYVDGTGKEMSAEKALAAVGERLANSKN